MKVGVIGSGQVGEVLANGFLKHGHSVMRGSRDPQKLADWLKTAGPNASTGDFAQTAAFGDMVVLAVKGAVAEAAVDLCAKQLAGKPVIDATNPISGPPDDGVLPFSTSLNESMMERLQARVPSARFVKAFSCVGSPQMVDPQLPGGPPTMFICGNDEDAKKRVQEVLTQFGWESEDMGGAKAARAIEPLCILWCIRGFMGGGWNHAFKLLRQP